MLYANDLNWGTSKSTSHLESTTEDDDDNNDYDNNIIKLQLKKPKVWNWELTTSKSSPNIAFPRILLYNDKGDLLADANDADCTFKGSEKDLQKKSAKKRSSTTTSNDSKRQSTSSSLKSLNKKERRLSSTNNNLKEINEYLDNFVDHLETKGIDYKLRRHHSYSNGTSNTTTNRPVYNERKLKRYDSSITLKNTESVSYESNTNETNNDFVESPSLRVQSSIQKPASTKYNDVDDNSDDDGGGGGGDDVNDKLENFLDNEPEKSDTVSEIPIWVYSEKGLLQRDWNAKEFDHMRPWYKKSNTTNLDVIYERTGTSCNDLRSSNKRSTTPVKEVRFNLQKSKSAIEIPDKKKSRRPNNSSGPSKFSGSILERMSAFKKMSSSTDSQDIEITTIPDRPRYFLRTSKAGTLVVCEENFRNRKIRRRPNKIPQNEENDNNREKFIQKYVYAGQEGQNHKVDNKNRYDAAIANIDNLISKVSLKSNKNPCQIIEDKSFQDRKIPRKINDDIKTNGILHDDNNLYDNDRNIRSTPKLVDSSNMTNPKKNRNGQFSLASYGLMTKNMSSLVNSKSTSNFLTVEPINVLREQSVSSDCKVKRRKKLKDLKRSISAGTVFDNLSSDEDNFDLNRKLRTRSKRKTYSRDELFFEQPEQKSSREILENRDQILTLNNNLPTVQSVGSTADIIDETSDEVLLRFVQHLASLTQQQQQDQNQFNENNFREPIDKSDNTNFHIENVENGNYQPDTLQNNNKENFNDELNDRIFEKGSKFKTFDSDTVNSSKYIENQSKKNQQEFLEGDIRKESHHHHHHHTLHELLNGHDDNSDKKIVQNSVKLCSNEDYDDKNKKKKSECDIIKGLSNSEFNEIFVNSKYQEYLNSSVDDNLKCCNNNNNNCSAFDNVNNNLISDCSYCDTHVPTFETECDQESHNFITNMGSNVSRNSGKGLSGRRTQSSGNLYHGKHQQNGACHPSNTNATRGKHSTMPSSNNNENHLNGSCRVKRKTGSCSEGSAGPSEAIGGADGGCNTTLDRGDILDYPSESCPTKLMMSSPLCGVTKRDRNKFCGSLPNHLDNDDNNIDVVENDTSIPNNHIHTENSEVADQVEYVTVVAPRRQQAHHHHQQHQQHSPYNNSVSEKETASTSSGSSTFKINQDKPDIQLKLPLTRSNFDPGCDQGYGSERSPEDEVPPSMPNMTPSPYQQGPISIDWDYIKYNNEYSYNFITKDCTFCVQITKGPRGLGLSISGGIDSNAPFPGLIRIKRLFPHQAAWSTGQLQPGDIILEVNGISITGLTNYDALEVLRTMPNDVVLLICRPIDEQYKKLSPPTEPPKPPQRTQQQGTQTLPDPDTYPLQPLTPLQTNFTGEFEIIMVKQQGSLGFTLRKEDESVLGHYVRALVREPATTDGRIKPGDKIVAVNDVPLSPMTHEQAVIFLRQAADTVKLRLYRDEAQTPVAAMSPATSENKTICGTLKKTYLRPEAINLLSDLAYKKQIPQGDSTESSIKSNNTSPRRLRRGTKTQNSNSGNTSQSEQDTTDSKSSSNPQYLVCSQTTSVCSDSEQSMASQCSYIVQPADTRNSDELFKMPSDTSERPDRPSFLDLAGQSGSTPVVSRKPRFQFTVAANAYELNNLDNDALDAPMYTSNPDGDPSHRSTDNQLPDNHEFTSLPCETFLIACKTENDLKNEANFNHMNPMYQSAHAQVLTQIDDNNQMSTTKKDGNKSLLKWKGVVFSPDEEENQTPEADSSCDATAGTNPTPGTERDFDLKEFSSSSTSSTNAEGYKIISVELNRGWNSRLGFSLQPDPNTGKTIIRAIYSDSVAAKDGRLRVGDLLLTVNDEQVESMPTSEIIDLLRIIRGSIVITVLRKDVQKSQPPQQQQQQQPEQK